MGIETMPSEEADEALQAMDQATIINDNNNNDNNNTSMTIDNRINVSLETKKSACACSCGWPFRAHSACDPPSLDCPVQRLELEKQINSNHTSTANLLTNTMDFRGFDSSIILS